MTETQQRFLRAIAERVPMGQVVELHLFPPIRQGGVETGMAVVAEDPRQPVAVIDGMEAIDATADLEATDAEDADASPYLDEDDVVVASDDIVADAVAGNGHATAPPVSRLIIHTARYRLTLKGVDRGKWEVDVVAEADAPLAAVDAVVRGVQRRSGESGAEPDRLTSDAFLEALNAPLASLER